MASSLRHSRRRNESEPRMPTRAELKHYRIVLTPAAREVLGDEGRASTRLEEVTAERESPLSEEVLLWEGEGHDRVVGLINKYVGTVYMERFGAPGSDSDREHAIKVVDLGIGARPDLRSGVDYVRRVRGIWRGLLPRERS